MGLQLFLIVQSAKQLRQQGDEPDHPGHDQHAAQHQLSLRVALVGDSSHGAQSAYPQQRVLDDGEGGALGALFPSHSHRLHK